MGIKEDLAAYLDEELTSLNAEIVRLQRLYKSISLIDGGAVSEAVNQIRSGTDKLSGINDKILSGTY